MGRVMGRVMGVDLGTSRVGIALSDVRAVLATPFTTIRRTSDTDVIAQLLTLAHQEEVTSIVVGIPKSLSSQNTIAQDATEDFITILSSQTDLPIIRVDERFTTVLATHRLRQLGHDSRSMKSKIDSSAAAEILQSYLDSRDNKK